MHSDMLFRPWTSWKMEVEDGGRCGGHYGVHCRIIACEGGGLLFTWAIKMVEVKYKHGVTY